MFSAGAVAFLVAALLILFIFRLAFGRRLHMSGGGRARQPRLGIVDAFDLDRQRQLVLVRRDNVEHLIMIGGPNDVLIESEIVRAEAREAARPREATVSPLTWPGGPAAPAASEPKLIPEEPLVAARELAPAPREPAVREPPVREAPVREVAVREIPTREEPPVPPAAAPAAPLPVPPAAAPAAAAPAAAPGRPPFLPLPPRRTVPPPSFGLKPVTPVAPPPLGAPERGNSEGTGLAPPLAAPPPRPPVSPPSFLRPRPAPAVPAAEPVKQAPPPPPVEAPVPDKANPMEALESLEEEMAKLLGRGLKES